MNLGYCCINETLKTSCRSITVKKYSTLDFGQKIEIIKKLSLENLETVLKIILWNIQNNIKLFRASSDIIPLGGLYSDFIFENDPDIINICSKIRNLIIMNNITLTIHPSQFVVLTSKDEIIINNSINELIYHQKLSNLLGINTIIIHVGGTYGDRESAMATFIQNFRKLPEDCQKKIAIENDERSYNANMVLKLCQILDCRMIFDYHHHKLFPSEFNYKILLELWKDSIPIFHLSSSANTQKLISKHSDYIDLIDYISLIREFPGNHLIEIEAKKKELSLLKLREDIKTNE